MTACAIRLQITTLTWLRETTTKRFRNDLDTNPPSKKIDEDAPLPCLGLSKEMTVLSLTNADVDAAADAAAAADARFHMA